MEELQSILKGELKKDFPIYKFSWFKVGGNAEYFYSPLDVEDLQNFLAKRPKDLKVTILGAGSNILVSDAGIKGFVLRLNHFDAIEKISANKFKVDCGVMNTSFANYALNEECSGFEFLSGIPGSLGGAVAMNAGSFNAEFKDICLEVEAMDMEGNLVKLSLKDLGFVYRGNSLTIPYIFLNCLVQGELDSKNNIAKKMTDIHNIRIETQPKKVKTGGSTFANPEGKKAWQLIDAVGLRGFRIGGSFFSEKHCNFIINESSSKSADIEELINEAKKRVKDQFNIDLRSEIKILK